MPGARVTRSTQSSSQGPSHSRQSQKRSSGGKELRKIKKARQSKMKTKSNTAVDSEDEEDEEDSGDDDEDDEDFVLHPHKEEEDEEDSDFAQDQGLDDNNDEATIKHSSRGKKSKHYLYSSTPRIPVPSHEKLTMENYSEVGRRLGRPVLEQLLADPKRHTKNRPPPHVVAEAEARQGFYVMDKMALSLVGSTSLQTLESNIGERPESRERHGYTTWLSYSLVNTVETTMPAPKQPEGFTEHNAEHRKWSQLSKTAQKTFQPQRFERLAFAHFPEVATPINGQEMASAEDITTYLPEFQRLVNLPKVRQHLEEGVLGKSIARSVRKIEKQGRVEVSRLAGELQTLQKRFGIESHLIVASWNPRSTSAKALWSEEHTTCERWAESANREYHVQESFAHESTRAPKATQGSSSQHASSKPQEALRKELSDLLNREYRKNLPHQPSKPKQFVHPKGPSPDLLIASKRVQNIQLAVSRTGDYKVTDEMLRKGPKPGKLTDEEVRNWIADIHGERYQVVVVNPPNIP